MPRRSSSLPGCVLGFSLILVLCMIGVAVLAITSGGPTSLTSAPALENGALSGSRALQRAYLALRGPALSRPAGDPTAMAEVLVLPGESAEVVIDRLAGAGILHDKMLLRIYLSYYGLDTQIQAGRYALTGEMSIAQIAEALQLAIVNQERLTVPEGWRMEQIADALPSTGIAFSAEEFLEAAHDSARLEAVLGIDAKSTEGFLFPETYALGAGTSADELVGTMLSTFDERITPDLRNGFKEEGLSLQQAVVLASIVEREAIVPDERRLIAGVFLNRLREGMRLEADPTVQYALGQQDGGGWWKAPLTLADLELDSPYNTYLYSGLPPAPIASPGLSSLQAVADPAQTEFFFFRAACDGSGRHLFAVSFDEHVGNACP